MKYAWYRLRPHGWGNGVLDLTIASLSKTVSRTWIKLKVIMLYFQFPRQIHQYDIWNHMRQRNPDIYLFNDDVIAGECPRTAELQQAHYAHCGVLLRGSPNVLCSVRAAPSDGVAQGNRPQHLMLHQPSAVSINVVQTCFITR